MKRILAMVLALAMVFSMIPATALQVHAEDVAAEATATETTASETTEAQQTTALTEPDPAAATEETSAPETVAATESATVSGTCGENLTWVLDDAGTLTISGSGEMTSSPWCDSHRSDITAVVIEEGVTNICFAAFMGCRLMTELAIPASVTSIDEEAFTYCYSLQSFSVASGNTAFCASDGVLFSADMTKLIAYPAGKAGNYTIPNTVNIVGYKAFSCATIEQLTIPASVTSLEDYAFDGDISFYVVADNTAFASGSAGELYSKDMTVLYRYCTNQAGETYTVADGVVTIANGAFQNGISKVVFPDSVQTIGGWAFNGAYTLESVTFGTGLKEIGDCAFQTCPGLKTIYFTGNAPTFSEIAFNDSVTATAYYPAGNTTWTADVMQNYGEGSTITWVAYDGDIPAETEPAETEPAATEAPAETEPAETEPAATEPAATEGEDETLSGTCGDSLNWTLVDGVLTVSGEGKMYDYNYMSPAPWYSYRNDVTSIIVESGITHIGSRAFRSMKNVTSISLHEGLESIYWEAFNWLEALTTITIPASVTSIGIGNFVGCGSLMNIEVADGSTAYCDVDGVLFTKDCTTLCTFPGGRRGSYTIPEGVTKIGNNAFEWSYLNELILPETLEVIGSHVFSGCQNLKTLRFPAALKEIGTQPFINCTLLASYDVAEDNAYFRDVDGVLFNKDATTLVHFPLNHSQIYTIPSTVTTIDDYAFQGANMGSLTVPASVTLLNDMAFCGFSGRLVFEGNAPDFEYSLEKTFHSCQATAYYPENAEGWADVVGQSLDYGTLNWISYGEEGIPALDNTSWGGATELALNETVQFEVPETSTYRYYTYTPDEDGYYVLYSVSTNAYPYLNVYEKNAGSWNWVLSCSGNYCYTSNGSTYNNFVGLMFMEGGKTYGFRVRDNRDVGFSMTLEKSNIVSVDVVPSKEIYEFTYGYWYDDYYDYCDEDLLQYTITFDDGTQHTGTGSYNFQFKGDSAWSYFTRSSVSPEPWVAGNTYDMTFDFLGKKYPFALTIKEAPEDITLELEPIKIAQDSYYGWHGGYDANNEYVRYKYYYWYKCLEGTITINGNTYDIYDGKFFFDEAGYECELWHFDDQSVDTPWGIGTHEATVGTLGIEQTIEVLIYDEWEIAEKLTLDQGIAITELAYQNYRTFTFTPEEDGYYMFSSLGHGWLSMKVYEQQEAGTWTHLDWSNGGYYPGTDNGGPVHLMPMSAGKTYGLMLTNYSEWPISVTVMVEKTDITNVVAADSLNIYEYTHGYWDEPQGYWDEAYEGYYYYTNLASSVPFTITYADGTQEITSVENLNSNSLTVNGKQIDLYYDWSLDQYQSSTYRWTAGNSYGMDVDVLGSTYSVSINILEAPENVTLTLDPITASIYDFEEYYENFGDGEEICWREYQWQRYITGTVTIDGTDYAIRNGRFYYPDAGYYCDLWFSDDQAWNNQWDTETEHTATAGTLGVQAECYIVLDEVSIFDDSIYDYIDKAPAVADMTPMALDTMYTVNIQACGEIGWFTFTPEVSGTYYFASTGLNNSWYDTYGLLFNGSLTECLAKNDDVNGSIQFGITQALTAGQTYILAAKMLSSDATGSFQVSVTKALSMTGLTVEPISFPADAFCGTEFYSDESGIVKTEIFYEWAPAMQGTAVFEDGSTVSFYGNSFQLNGISYYLDFSDTQGNERWSVGNTYPVSVYCGDLTVDTTVTLTANSIKSVTFKDIILPENQEDPWYNWLPSLSWTVKFTDGKSLSGSGSSFYYKNNRYYICGWDNQGDPYFTAGNTYEVTAAIATHIKPVNVTIKAINHDLPAVTGLNVAKVTANSIQITFDKLDGANKYELYLDGAYVASTSKNTYTFTNLTAGDYYEIDVAAVFDGVSGPLTGGFWAKPYTDISKYTVTLEPDTFAYDGTPKIPSVILKNGSKIIDADYYVYECFSNLEVGQALLVLEGRYIYGGGILTDFKIVPPQVTGLEVTELDDENGIATIVWEPAHGATEYWVYNGTKRVAVIEDPTVTTYTFEGLKLGTTYGFSVRANAKVLEYDLTNYNIYSPEEPEQRIADYTGEASETVTVRPAQGLENSTVQITGVPKAYTGKALTATVKVIGPNGKTLKSGSDYTVSYENNIEVGTATVIITGKGKYEGTLTDTFDIVPAKAGTPTVKQIDGTSAEVSFKEVKQAQWYEILVDGEVNGRTEALTFTATGLTAGKAHKFTVRAGVTIDGKDYVGEQGSAKTATVKHDMDICSLSLEQSEFAYTGKALKPTLTVTGYNGTVLTEKVDYTVAYKNNKNTGMATVTVNGKGAYAGKAETTFIINPAQPAGLNVKSTTPTSVTVTFTKSASAQYYEVYLDGALHGETRKNTYTFTGLVKGEIHDVKLIPKKAIKDVVYTGEESDTIQIWAGTDIAKFKVTQEYVRATYAGEPMCPTVVVKTSAKKTAAVLTEGVDYKVTYLNNNAPGKASLVIQGIGEYAGVITKTYTIFMDKPSGVTATATATDTIHVEFNPVPGAMEYQVCVNGKVKATITDTSCEITGLKKNTTYKITVKAVFVSETYKQTTVSPVVKVKTPNA